MQRRRLEALQAKRERARRNLESSARSLLLRDTWEDLGRAVGESWDMPSVQARRDIIELVIDEIVVDPAKRARMPARERVRIRWDKSGLFSCPQVQCFDPKQVILLSTSSRYLAVDDRFCRIVRSD